MPTYDYECKKCGHRLEAFQYFSEKPLKKCPACGKRSLNRLIGTGAAVIFKGSGFYETDYKRSRASSKSNGSAANGSSSESKSDSSGVKESSTKKE